jgi:hypothetical protein
MNKAFTFRTHSLALSAFGDTKERRDHAKRGRIVGFLIADEDNGEGEVILEKDFLKNDNLFVCDVMGDFVNLLHNEHDERLRQFNKEYGPVVASALNLYHEPDEESEPSKGRVPPS